MRLSGQGFRPSSREKDKGGDGELRCGVLNFAQDDLSYASQMKIEIMQLQEEIDKFDIDGKLRSSTNLEFMKSYIASLKKWLAANSDQNVKKEIDARSLQNLEIDKILQVLNAKNAEEGLKKLFKMVRVLDYMVNKYTEYEILAFIKYEDIFNQLNAKYSNLQSKKLSWLSNGVNTNKFHVAFLNLERMMELFSICSKLQQEGLSKSMGQIGGGQEAPRVNLGAVKTRQDLIACLESLTDRQMQEDLKQLILKHLSEASSLEDNLNTEKLISKGSATEIQQKIHDLEKSLLTSQKEKTALISRFEQQQKVIDQLKGESAIKDDRINQLKESVNLLKVHLEKLKNQSATQQAQEKKETQSLALDLSNKSKDDPQYWVGLMDQLRNQFEVRINNIENESVALKEKMLEKNITIDKQQQEIVDLQNIIKEFNQWKKEIMYDFHKKFDNSAEYQAAYEKALLNEVSWRTPRPRTIARRLNVLLIYRVSARAPSEPVSTCPFGCMGFHF